MAVSRQDVRVINALILWIKNCDRYRKLLTCGPGAEFLIHRMPLICCVIAWYEADVRCKKTVN